MSDERGSWTHASDALADSLCAGRHFAQRGIAEAPRSEDAAFGDTIHLALSNPQDVQITQHMTVAERDVFEACREVEKAKVLEFFGDDTANTTGEERRMRVFREQRYWGEYDSPFGRIRHSAKLDACFRKATKALIVEYKTLPGDVPDSPKNLQLRDQMVLAWGNLVTLEAVGVVVVQPLVTRNPVICVYTNEDRLTAEKLLVERIIASNNPASARIAGDVQCKFCKAALADKCPEYRKWATQVAPVSILGLFDVPMEQWTPDQLSRVLVGIKAFEKLSERIIERSKGILQEGLPIPGWRLKPGATKETITDPQKCFERFGTFGGSLEQFMGAVAIGKTKLKEALRTATGAKGKTLDKQFSDLLSGIVEQSQNKPSLVKEDEN